MLLLVSTTDKMEIVTGQAASIDVHTSWMDYDSTTPTISTPGRKNVIVATATTTDITGSPGSATIARNVKTVNVRNKHATQSCDVTIRHTDGTTAVELIKVTLNSGEGLTYVEGIGWFEITATSQAQYLTNFEPSNTQNVVRSALGQHPVAAVGNGLALTAATAYCVYMGRTVRAVTVAFLEFVVTSAGAGTQTAEAGIFSSPAPPNKSSQTLTKLAATGTVDATTGTGVKRNTSSFALAIAANVHVWAVLRVSMATTQPTLAGLGTLDWAEGLVETLASASALTGITTLAATIPAHSTAVIAPELRLTLN